MARKKPKKSVRELERASAPRGRFNADQPEDPRPGFYYVTAMDGGRSARAAGPYGTHAAALDDVYRVKEEIERGDPRAAFYAWGTMRSETNLGPGFLSQPSRAHQRTKKDRGVVYTDTMIAAMCDAPWYWESQIRAAAKQRNVKATSVTPLADVIRALRATTSNHQRVHQTRPTNGTGTFLVQYVDKLGMEREVYVSHTTERAVRADARRAGFRILAIKRTGR